MGIYVTIALIGCCMLAVRLLFDVRFLVLHSFLNFITVVVEADIGLSNNKKIFIISLIL